jgi:hypothetical protein
MHLPIEEDLQVLDFAQFWILVTEFPHCFGKEEIFRSLLMNLIQWFATRGGKTA